MKYPKKMLRSLRRSLYKPNFRIRKPIRPINFDRIKKIKITSEPRHSMLLVFVKYNEFVLEFDFGFMIFRIKPAGINGISFNTGGRKKLYKMIGDWLEEWIKLNKFKIEIEDDLKEDKKEVEIERKTEVKVEEKIPSVIEPVLLANEAILNEEASIN